MLPTRCLRHSRPRPSRLRHVQCPTVLTVLPRIAAGIELTKHDFVVLGEGGLIVKGSHGTKKLPRHTKNHLRARVITVSDRSSRGERADSSGPARCLLGEKGFAVEEQVVLVPDEHAEIVAALHAAVADNVALIVTTGGTGFSPRDITPEATCEV